MTADFNLPPPPQFTREERYLISYYLRKKSASLIDLFLPELGASVPTLAFVIWGLLADSVAMVAVGFFVLLALKLIDTARQAAYLPAVSSLIWKFASYVDSISGTTLIANDEYRSANDD